jgi:hypothetical protein
MLTFLEKTRQASPLPIPLTLFIARACARFASFMWALVSISRSRSCLVLRARPRMRLTWWFRFTWFGKETLSRSPQLGAALKQTSAACFSL